MTRPWVLRLAPSVEDHRSDIIRELGARNLADLIWIVITASQSLS